MSQLQDELPVAKGWLNLDLGGIQQIEGEPQPNCYYRYHEVVYSVGGYDVHGEYVHDGSRTEVHLDNIPIIKVTPRGAWIGWREDEKQFVCNNWHKRFACPTIEEARVSFLARKQAQIDRAQRQIMRAQEAIAVAKKLWEKDIVNAANKV